MQQVHFPKVGTKWEDLRARMIDLSRRDICWRDGRTALHVYYAGDDVLNVAREAYGMFMMESALAPIAFPSLAEMERELIGAAIELFRGSADASGSLTSGGTESIFLAMKAARDWTRASRPNIKEPFEIIMPRTVHPAFDKAAHYLGMTTVRVATRVGHDIDVASLFEAVSPQTIMVVASAPNFPYGTIDPIRQIAERALERDLWFHVDACIGGFLAPFAKKLGYAIPDFDFSLPGVRSLSADLHKYGYAAKGASLVLFARRDYSKFQGTEFSDWPKGRYYTPTMLGTRPGGATAAAWAVMHYLGEEGYLRLASRVMNAWKTYVTHVQRIPELEIVGAPHLAVLAFTSVVDQVDIFAVANELTDRGWYVSKLAEPAGIHQIINLAHENVIDSYFDDVQSAIHKVYKYSMRARDRGVVTY
jgi:glutamate/tyrosine decarboxylase-like PLP-dependent enzyme